MDERMFSLLCEAAKEVLPPLCCPIGGVERHFELVAGTQKQGGLLVCVHDGEMVSREQVAAAALSDTSPRLHLFLPAADGEREELAALRCAASGAARQPSLFDLSSPVVTVRGRVRSHFHRRLRRAEIFFAAETAPAAELERFQLQAAECFYPRFDEAQVEWPSPADGVDPLTGCWGVPCRAVRDWIGPGISTGGEVRSHFQAPPCGWPEEAIFNALTLLARGGLLLVSKAARLCSAREINWQNWRMLCFHGMMKALSDEQRMELRALFDSCGVAVEEREEASLPLFIDKMRCLAAAAGGEPPQPVPPSSPLLDEIEAEEGQAKLLKLLELRAEVEALVVQWQRQTEAIAARMPLWRETALLRTSATGLPQCADLCRQVDGLVRRRGLLTAGTEGTTALEELHDRLAEAVRAEVSRLEQQWLELQSAGEKSLAESAGWQRLLPESRNRIRRRYGLLSEMSPHFSADSGVVAVVTKNDVPLLRTALARQPERYNRARLEAEAAAEQELVFVEVKPALIRDETELQMWLKARRAEIVEALKEGAVLINDREEV